MGRAATPDNIIFPERLGNCLNMKKLHLCGCPIETCKCISGNGCEGLGSPEKVCEVTE